MSTEQPISPPEDFGDTLLEQIFTLWVEPEIAKRGSGLEREAVTKALVIMAPNRSPATLLNDEVKLVGQFRATRAIEAGEEITEDDIEDLSDLRPIELDPDAGWICFAYFKGSAHIAFDFRRNQSRCAELLKRAEEFLDAARLTLSKDLIYPTIDSAYGAAELVVCAHMYLIEDNPTRNHDERRRWFKDWTKLGNAPIEHSEALNTLGGNRNAARYADKAVNIKAKQLE